MSFKKNQSGAQRGFEACCLFSLLFLLLIQLRQNVIAITS